MLAPHDYIRQSMKEVAGILMFFLLALAFEETFHDVDDESVGLFFFPTRFQMLRENWKNKSFVSCVITFCKSLI